MDKKLRLHTVYDKNYSIMHPTDAYGGIVKNQFYMHLHDEIPKIADTFEYELDKGKLKPDSEIQFIDGEAGHDEFVNFQKNIYGTVVLTPENALKISIWMLKKLLKDDQIEVDKEPLKELFNEMLGEE